jgi:hypothetical protein
MASWILRGLMALAVAGTLASILALALGVGGLEAVSFEVALPGFVVGFVTAGALLTVHLILQSRVGVSGTRKYVQSGCPKGLRWLANGLGLCGLVVWVGLGVRGYEPPSDGVSTLLTGALGLFLFPGAFSTFFSYLRIRPELLRACSRGHRVPLGARFCPECGESVRRVE